MGGNSSKNKKLSKEDFDFLLNNTNFTKRQIKQWYKGFMVSRAFRNILLFYEYLLSNLAINWTRSFANFNLEGHTEHVLRLQLLSLLLFICEEIQFKSSGCTGP